MPSPAEEAENARAGNGGRTCDTATPLREHWMNRAAAGRRDRAIEAMARLRCTGWKKDRVISRCREGREKDEDDLGPEMAAATVGYAIGSDRRRRMRARLSEGAPWKLILESWKPWHKVMKTQEPSAVRTTGTVYTLLL
jgi:hypothetical protein